MAGLRLLGRTPVPVVPVTQSGSNAAVRCKPMRNMNGRLMALRTSSVYNSHRVSCPFSLEAAI